MFCPECGLEYEEGSSLCEDCGVELVEDPLGEEAPEELEFVPLGEVTDATVFAIVTSQLEEAGIPWFVQSEKESMAMVYVARNRLAEAHRELAAAASPVAVCEGN
ncbi:MAG: TFIIB-type zinc ribbon-containing protein [Acidobacteria bacterium]|nr:TFIIB-type zinc ribbon-containing protein [Acidobacteriota bacterium]